MTATLPTTPCRRPAEEAGAHTAMTDFARWVIGHRPVGFDDPTDRAALHRWSVTDLEGFWSAVWEYFRIDAATPYTKVLGEARMPGARWFSGATLNYAHHALRNRDADAPAVIALDETGSGHELSALDLRAQVGSLTATLRDLGVREGDRVVGYLPNTPHAVIAFLATASLGAIWSVCGQDHPPGAAAERFARLRPTVLVSADGYLFNGARHDRRQATLDIAAALPTVRATVLVDRVGLPWPRKTYPSLTITWEDAATRQEDPTCVPVPFDHPLWVVFSSGATGLPKAFVHSHGGVLLEHLKTLGLHAGLGPGDRQLGYTTPHSMLWNMTVSALLTGATTCTYEGSPAPLARPDVLWQLASRHRVTRFCTSPSYLLSMARFGIKASRHDLSSVRTVATTGSVLHPAAHRWVRDRVGGHVEVTSSVDCADVVSGFAGGSPDAPDRVGELSAPYLGVALAAYDDEGLPVTDRAGELVVTRPMPSMPLSLWNDPVGQRYRDTYFSVHPGVWRQGDLITHTSRGSVIVHGRSDAVLHDAGVRLSGTEIHDVVERLPEVQEALVVGVEEPDNGYWVPLFVVLAAGVVLDGTLRDRIRRAVRAGASPLRIPDEILEVRGIPHTRSGEKLEIPVRRLLQGTPVDDVIDLATVDEPALIDHYVQVGTARRTRAARSPEGAPLSSRP